MLKIKKIQLRELSDFIRSEEYEQFSVVPITPLRVQSYLNNPRARQTDVILYLGFIDEKLVAFRSLFADEIIREKEVQRFGWCSGTWVHPDFHRKGFSLQLLNEAYHDWDKRLMFTNYATESEKLYLKTGWFSPIHKFEGVRGYLFPKTRKLLHKANGNAFFGFVFSVVDFLLRIFSELRLFFYSVKPHTDFRFEALEFPDNECYHLIEQGRENYLFARGEKELKWIFSYPWVSVSDNTFMGIYPFSSFSKGFMYKTVKVFNKDQFSGFFIFSVREGYLKTLYFVLAKDSESEVARYLKKFCVENKIQRITVYEPNVARQLSEDHFPLFGVKPFGQKIYSTFHVKGEKEYCFQDGDGDMFFT